MTTPIQAHVLYCTAFDATTHECISQAWLPAPSLLPPLTIGQAGQLLAASLVVFAIAWGCGEIVRAIKS